MDDDTIAALSTPPGRGAIAIIRLSGSRTLEVLRQIIDHPPLTFKPRFLYHRTIVSQKIRLDEGLVSFFKGPNSYTGEDMAEISIHANPFIVEEVLNLILQFQVRQALPGEFTYRAYKNNKMDLIQAEAVNELIQANSRYSALAKFGSVEGKLSQLIARIRENILQMGVKIETRLEFEEEQHFPAIEFTHELAKTITMIEEILSQSRYNEIISQAIKVVITGKTNVGKSSLFNRLLLEERSITSPIPGTTRDYIRERLNLDGWPVEIIDVAGLNRQSKDQIESMGMERSREKIKTSQAVIFVLDASTAVEDIDLEIYQLIKDKPKLMVANKIDISGDKAITELESLFPGEKISPISVKKEIHLDTVHQFLKGLLPIISHQDSLLTINQRQKSILERILSHLTRISNPSESSINLELTAEELRQVMKLIGELTGEIGLDEILNTIFGQFCIGK